MWFDPDKLQINSKTKPFQILNYTLFFGLGVFLLWLAFRNQNFEEIILAIKSANLWMVVPVIIASMIGSVIRALRWQMLIKPLGFNPSFFNLFNSMMFGYFVNYAIPRVGELVRCVTLKKKEDIPIASSFGTVMSERMVDLIMLFICIGLSLLLQFSMINSFFSDNIFGPIVNVVRDKLFRNVQMSLITVAVIGVLIYLLFFTAKKEAKKDNSGKIDALIDEVWVGINGIFKLKNYGLFLIYTLTIWVMYFCTSYFWLLAFKSTSDFSIMTGLTIMVISSLARSVPIQGGAMGAYHILVTKGLGIFGVSAVVGNAYAIVNHGSQMIFQLILGSICGMILFLSKDKVTLKEDQIES